MKLAGFRSLKLEALINSELYLMLLIWSWEVLALADIGGTHWTGAYDPRL